MALTSLNDDQKQRLLKLAKQAIEHGLATGSALAVNLSDYPPELREPLATFVTLRKSGRLRGCIGTLAAVKPLVADIAENAYAAAFRDPRFPPLEAAELAHLDILCRFSPPPNRWHSAVKTICSSN